MSTRPRWCALLCVLIRRPPAQAIDPEYLNLEGLSFVGQVEESTGYIYALYSDDVNLSGQVVLIKCLNGEVMRHRSFGSLGAAVNWIVRNSEDSIALRRNARKAEGESTRGMRKLNRRRVEREVKRLLR